MKNMKDTMGRYQADNEEYRQNLSVAKEELAKQQEMLARYKEEQQNRESYEQQLREQEERMEELNEKLKRYRAERDELQEKADSLERRLQEEPRHIERELVVQKPVPENSDRPAEDEAVSKDVDVKDDMPVWLDDLKDVILQNAEKEEKKEAPVPRKEEERTVSARSSRDAESSFRQPVSQTETDTVKNGAEELSGKLRMAEAEKFRMKRQAEEREAELAVLSEKLKKQLESNQILSEEIDKLYADYSKSESRRKILEEDSEQKKFLLKFYMEKNEENLLLKNDLKKKSDTVKALKKALEQVMNQMKAQTDNIKVYSERAIRESEQHSKAMAELAQMKIRGVELLDQVNMLSEKNRQMKEENENLQRELTELRQKSTELGAESKVLSMKAPRNMMEETGFEKELQKCTEAYEQAKEIIRAAL